MINKKTKPKIIFFFPHNPCPPYSGAHIRCLQILKTLIKLNYEIYLLSSTYTSDTKWDNLSLQKLENLGIKKIFIYNKNLLDKIIIWLIKKYYFLICKLPPVNSLIYSPPGMRKWFKNLQKIIKPDIIFMNYVYWDKLINRVNNNSYLIIDYYDLVSKNRKMQKAIMNYFQKNNLYFELLDDLILNEGFFSEKDYFIDKNELKIITSYNCIFAISQNEKKLIEEYSNKVNIIHIPVMYKPIFCSNSYSGSAIFVTGPNFFNLQGYFYFTKKVLPIIIQTCPNFNLWITGSCCKKIRSEKNISMLGYVPDLENYYCNAKFALIPVLGGTGQQIKIIEAMAHGVPVIVTEYSSKTAPVIHGYNGFIAKDAHSFAEHCIKLWQNPELCQKMGNAARKTIQENFSDEMLLKKISEVLEKT